MCVALCRSYIGFHGFQDSHHLYEVYDVHFDIVEDFKELCKF